MNFLKFLVLVGTKKWLPGTKFGTQKIVTLNKIRNPKTVTGTKFGAKNSYPEQNLEPKNG